MDTNLPDDCVLIRVNRIEIGDEVRFRNFRSNYIVEDVDTDRIGNVRHRWNGGTATCTYRPGETLWITRRAAR